MMISLRLNTLVFLSLSVLPQFGCAFAPIPLLQHKHHELNHAMYYSARQQQLDRDRRSAEERRFPEKTPATYELLQSFNPFEFGAAGFVRPLLKKTQLEKRALQVAYDANKHGWDAQTFHRRVDGKGAAIVIAKVRGQWVGGYNGRGWASLGGSRPSIAAFLFYKTLFGWQKLRVKGGGGLACSRDEYDQGIFFGADGLVIPLNGQDRRAVASRLGSYFEFCPSSGRSTLLPRGGGNFRCQELKVLTGVYGPNEDIPNSGGVTDLGLY